MNRALLLLLTCTLLLPAGCGRVKTVHQLPPGLELFKHEKTYLDRTFIAPEMNQILNRTLEVRLYKPKITINLSNAKIRQIEDDEWGKWRADFQNAIANHLYRARIFRDVSTPNDTRPLPNPDLRLDVAVTEWNEGIGWLRWMIGFGAGATRVQWEGSLYDTRTSRVLFAFADARIHPGGPGTMSLNFRPFYGGTLIAQDLRWATGDLAATLRKLLEIQAELDESAKRPTLHDPLPPAAPIRWAGPPPPGADLNKLLAGLAASSALETTSSQTRPITWPPQPLTPAPAPRRVNAPGSARPPVVKPPPPSAVPGATSRPPRPPAPKSPPLVRGSFPITTPPAKPVSPGLRTPATVRPVPQSPAPSPTPAN